MEETLEKNQNLALEDLMKTLEAMSFGYEELETALTQERDFLIAADLERLGLNNLKKEKIIYHLRDLEFLREKQALAVAKKVQLATAEPRLLLIAEKLTGDLATKMKNVHAALQKATARVQELNIANETYVRSALNSLSGAMGDVKETLAPKKTYGRSGKMAHGPDRAGNFVGKEA